MAMYNFNLHNFAYVEHAYNNTKPIRGSNIVPIGDRRRKRECIIKVSPHCYMLSDCGEHADITNAAVVWTRNADSTDTVEFRNGDGDYAHSSRYSFLERCVTMHMLFIVDGGKQYIRYDDKRNFLPKDCSKPVVFTTGKQTATWVLVSKPHPLPVTRIRVNKELKAGFTDNILEYLEWAWTMAPLIEGTMDWHTNMAAQRVASNTSWAMFQDMLMDNQHDQRTTMLHAFLCTVASYYNNRYWHDSTGNAINGGVNVSVTSDPKVFRTKFNAWINDRAGFNEQFNEFKDGE